MAFSDPGTPAAEETTMSSIRCQILLFGLTLRVVHGPEVVSRTEE